MIIVLTPERNLKHEIAWINDLFLAGLELLHIRKYNYSEEEMHRYILAIDSQFRDRLVLHSHHSLAKKTAVNRLHFNESDRLAKKHELYHKDYVLSTSAHAMVEFNALESDWTYAFLSPLFASISKHRYGLDSKVLADLKLRKNNDVKLIGLGGIRAKHIPELLKSGLDGVALLGTIWENQQPITSFKKCLQNDLTY